MRVARAGAGSVGRSKTPARLCVVMVGKEAKARVVVDTRAWAGKTLYFDLLALAVLLLSAGAIGLDIYAYLAAGTDAQARDRALLVLVLALAAFIASYAWIAGRLVRAAVREATTG